MQSGNELKERPSEIEIASPSALTASRHRRRFQILLAVGIAVGVFAASRAWHAFYVFSTASHHLWDELLGAATALSVIFIVYLVRRWHGILHELADGHRHQVDLRRQQAELESRVERRTAELRVINTALEVEVNEHKRTAAALREQREQWRTLVETSADGVFVVQDGRFTFLNPTALRLFGATRLTDLLGLPVLDFVHGNFREIISERIEQALAQATALPILEQKIRQLDGTVIDVEATSVRFHYADRPALLVEMRDISERKQAQEERRESDRRFREMLANVDLIAMTLDTQGRITFCNDYLLRLTGWTREEVMDQAWFDLFIPECAIEVRELFFSAMANASLPAHYENPIKTKSGELKTIAWNNTMLRDVAGKIVGTASIGEDVTDRKRAEHRRKLQYAATAALAEADSASDITQKVLATIAESLGAEMGKLWLVDRSANALKCADVWQSSPALGDVAAIYRSLCLNRGSGLAGAVWELGKTMWVANVASHPSCIGQPQLARLGLKSWIGIPILARHEVAGVVGLFLRESREPDPVLQAVLTNIGAQIGQAIERHRMAEQLRQSQKLEAIGTLAGGIAHDFNNILGAIAGYADLARIGGDHSPRTGQCLDGILAGTKRATALVRQILAFSRQEKHERKPIQLRHIVREALDLLRATIPTTIEFDVFLATDAALVCADPCQIHQIVMNLGTNAVHAMAGRPGRLLVRLENFTIHESFASTQPKLQAGPHVRLTVSDTGCGMNRATVDRIFEPFFTTKGPGEGTGLGLAVVHGIVTAHQGAITVYSEPGEGTTFHVYFPAQVGEVGQSVSSSAVIPRGNGERILYVDDEPPLSHTGSKIMQYLGYSVEVCATPLEALEAFRRDSDGFDLVVTDQTMPKMTGLELAEHIHLLRPDLPIILMSGYTATITSERLAGAGIATLLLKPVSVENLGAAIHEAIRVQAPAALNV